MLGARRQRGHEGHGGGAASDHDHALARAVEAGRPVLGMNHRALEALAAGEGRAVALVVAVVAGASVQEAAAQPRPLAAVGVFDLHRPASLGARPLGAHGALPEANARLDPVLAGRRADVLEDRRAADQRGVLLPRAERVGEREHVRVRAHAGVAEEIPRAAERVARLDDREGPPGKAPAQVTGRADPREARSHDQDVHVLGRRVSLGPCWRVGLLRPCPRGLHRGHTLPPAATILAGRPRGAPALALAAALGRSRAYSSGRSGRSKPKRSPTSHAAVWLPWAGIPPARLIMRARCMRFQVMNVALRLVKSFSGPPEPSSR